MKAFIVYSGLAILSFIINFLIYIYSFNVQATPFLHEEQRVDSAIQMFTTTLPAYSISAVVIAFIFSYVARVIYKK